MKIRTKTKPILLSLSFALIACESPEERLDRLIDESKACEDGDRCVLAGGSDCTCAEPVNEDHAAEVDAAAKEIECCDLIGRCVAVGCASFQEIRCEAGECIGE